LPGRPILRALCEGRESGIVRSSRRRQLVQLPVSRYNPSMNRSAQEILEDARQLPPGEVNWLIENLLQEGDGCSDAEIDASWKAEVERRIAESEAGTAATCSWEEVEAPLRARLAR